MIPDAHAHLDLIEKDTGSVVASAHSAGVSPIVTIGITVASSIEAVRMAGEFRCVYASVGIHPNDTAAFSPRDIDSLEEIALSSNRVVAIGETGLDYYRDRSAPDAQKEAFRAHIRLARKLELALIVHDRQAHGDVLDILAGEGAMGGESPPVVMHCFSGDRDLLEECLGRGYYISFAGPVTFRKSTAAREIARAVPLEKLLAETDSPFLSPEPFRGKPNLPERVRFVAEELARAHSLPLERMEDVLTANTRRAFGIPAGEAGT